MKNKYLISAAVLLLLSLGDHAQPYATNPDFNRTRNWHFGDGVGLRFDPDTVYVVSSNIHTGEAAAVHTDQDGSLLLYSNGETIWNANHEIIHNGNLALGHNSSRMGSIFVFHKDNPDSIYLFNTYYNLSTTKEFSVNLIVREADTFRVAYKDSVLMYNVCESIAVVKADNGRDIWIVVHEFEANNLYSYLLTAQGIVSCPVVSKSFSTPVGVHGAYLGTSFSSNGKYMIKSNTNLPPPLIIKGVEIYEFDLKNGKFKYLYSIDNPLSPLYLGVCFSSNNESIFVIERDSGVNAFKFNPMDSLTTVTSIKKFILEGFSSSLQKMPYKHGIVASRADIDGLRYLDFVVNVDNFDSLKVLEKKININYSGTVPPNFNQSYFHTPPVNFSYELNCISNTIQFHGQDTFSATSHNWLITKQGAIPMTASIKNPLIEFEDTGAYSVRYIASNGSRSDTLIKEITILPKINKDFLGSDTGWCENLGASLTLQAPSGMHCYEWNTGATGSTIIIDTVGVYWANIVTPNFCVLYDTITVTIDTVPNTPEIYKDHDTLKTNAVADRYQWLRYEQPTGENQPFLVLSDTGVYRLRVMTYGGCTAISDTIHIPDTSTINVKSIVFENIKLYPNPFTDKIEITDEDGSISSISVYTISGQKIYDGQVKDIDTSMWLDGIYQIIITLNDGQKITHKLIKA